LYIEGRERREREREREREERERERERRDNGGGGLLFSKSSKFFSTKNTNLSLSRKIPQIPFIRHFS